MPTPFSIVIAYLRILLFPGNRSFPHFLKRSDISTRTSIDRDNTRPSNHAGFAGETKKEEADKMVRRFHRSIYGELDERRASMDYLYQLALEPTGNPLLPEGESQGIVCQSVHNLNAEVAEHEDEVRGTLETVPGTGTSKISVDLITKNPRVIPQNREEGKGDGGKGEHQRERQSVCLHHLIPLPSLCTPSGQQ